MRTVEQDADAIGESTFDVLPERVQEALGELAGAAKEGLLALSVGVGLGVLSELMAEEVDDVVGPKGRHDVDRAAVREGDVTPGWLREQGYVRVKGMGDMWQHPETGDSVTVLRDKRPVADEESEPAPPPEPPQPPPEKEPWEPQDDDSGLLAGMRAEAASIMAKNAKLGTEIGPLWTMRRSGQGRTPEYDAKLAEAQALNAEIVADADAFHAQIPAWREEARVGEEEDMTSFEYLVQLVSGATHTGVSPIIDDLRSNREAPAEESAEQGDESAPADGAGGGGQAPEDGAGGGE